MNAVKFHRTLPTDEELQGINIWGERRSKSFPRMISLIGSASPETYAYKQHKTNSVGRIFMFILIYM